MSWLGDLIDDAVHGVENTADAAGSAIEGAAEATGAAIESAVRSAAVDLLNAVLPPMVHAEYGAVRAAAWAAIQVPVQALGLTVAGAKVDETVLAGLVAQKVTDGLSHLKENTHYAQAVNSIKW
ncbi:hypothetical protein [Arthrobacter bambusae]|uniref:HNH endonuclease n=1 Tax=Arthrobacter bambusae TaxID=1338426 RepID=A0AAW8DDY9_9MICC|nr:hypothetical protein [Arthrobacter bambusae]MDP9903284.1 hypothetical protein [Arthrobacter bambusae]MDQ0128722.1 hypothetical protein [Arthrobacter bambusae]MDQ0180063.1 hypothetical protein [Arthrobacter bambusae]